MNKMQKWVINNYNLTASELERLPAVVAEISAEIEQGQYVGDGSHNCISDSELCEALDEKLFYPLGLSN